MRCGRTCKRRCNRDRRTLGASPDAMGGPSGDLVDGGGMKPHRIPTRRSLVRRLGDLLEQHKLLPLAVVLVALYFINS